MGLGFELRALCLAKLVLCSLIHTSRPFCSDYFGDGKSFALADLEL
jgi:hypothetical protein